MTSRELVVVTYEHVLGGILAMAEAALALDFLIPVMIFSCFLSRESVKVLEATMATVVKRGLETSTFLSRFYLAMALSSSQLQKASF